MRHDLEQQTRTNVGMRGLFLPVSREQTHGAGRSPLSLVLSLKHNSTQRCDIQANQQHKSPYYMRKHCWQACSDQGIQKRRSDNICIMTWRGKIYQPQEEICEKDSENRARAISTKNVRSGKTGAAQGKFKQKETKNSRWTAR